jgi:glycosyltransferase involved in cell wall biosynthesis
MTAAQLRIAMLAPFGIRPKGTLLARMLPLAQALQQRGHQVLIIAPPIHNRADAATQQDHGGVTVVHTAFPALPEALQAITQAALMRRQLTAFRPDVVHLFKPKGYGGLAVLGLGKLPLVVDMDDWEGPGGWNDLLPYPAAARRLFAWQERDLPRRAAAVTVVSSTLQSLVWAMGVAADRVTLLPNGTAVSTLQAPRPVEQPPTLLFYTRFWECDLADLAATLQLIHQARPEIRLRLIGRGEQGQEQQLHALAHAQGWAAMIDDHGWLAAEAIPPLLAGSDVAIAPISDTLINRCRGMAKLLEIAAHGVPIVADDVGTARDLLAPDAGILVRPGDSQARAAAVLALFADAAERARLRSALLTAATRYRWTVLAERAEQVYQRACRSRP